MKSKLFINLSEILIIPIGIILSLAIFSYTIGWNILSMFIFWFLLIPLITNYLPGLIARKDLEIIKSLIGLLIFYAFMVLMIYEHFQSDYFILMMISFICNVGIALLIAGIRKHIPKKQN